MPSFLSLLRASFDSVSRGLFLGVLGSALARLPNVERPLFPPVVRKGLNHLVANIFLPSVYASKLARTKGFAQFATIWWLLPVRRPRSMRASEAQVSHWTACR